MWCVKIYYYAIILLSIIQIKLNYLIELYLIFNMKKLYIYIYNLWSINKYVDKLHGFMHVN
jgi:hypothetical protein